MTLVTRDPDNHYLRIDVMGTSKGEATCDSDLIDVMGEAIAADVFMF